MGHPSVSQIKNWWVVFRGMQLCPPPNVGCCRDCIPSHFFHVLQDLCRRPVPVFIEVFLSFNLLNILQKHRIWEMRWLFLRAHKLFSGRAGQGLCDITVHAFNLVCASSLPSVRKSVVILSEWTLVAMFAEWLDLEEPHYGGVPWPSFPHTWNMMMTHEWVLSLSWEPFFSCCQPWKQWSLMDRNCSQFQVSEIRVIIFHSSWKNQMRIVCMKVLHI